MTKVTTSGREALASDPLEDYLNFISEFWMGGWVRASVARLEMRKDLIIYGIVMLLLGTLLVWIVYPYWADAVWLYTNFGVWTIGNTDVLWAGMIFATALSLIFYVGGGIVLWKGFREPAYRP